MLKLPAGYGCDAGDATDENGAAARQAQAQQQQQFHNLPVAVAVPMSGIPNLQRQRSLNAPGGSGSGAGGAPVRRKTAHQFSFRSLTGSEFIRLADFAGKVCSCCCRVFSDACAVAGTAPSVVRCVHTIQTRWRRSARAPAFTEKRSGRTREN